VVAGGGGDMATGMVLGIVASVVTVTVSVGSGRVQGEWTRRVGWWCSGDIVPWSLLSMARTSI
jgi:hypothetical protein